VDNKYRLRKLLQQCSIEEIRSVALPKALDIISVGDFFTFKVTNITTLFCAIFHLHQQIISLKKHCLKIAITDWKLGCGAAKVGNNYSKQYAISVLTIYVTMPLRRSLLARLSTGH